MAHISASLGSYDKAIEILEQVAAASTSGPTKWSVKDYLFKAGILHLARGVSNSYQSFIVIIMIVAVNDMRCIIYSISCNNKKWY